MSESTNKSDFRLDPESSWAGAYKVAGALGVLGLIGAAVGGSSDMHRFAFSYLFAYIAVLTIALGAIFFCLIQWLTNSGWSVTVRRITEFLLWPIGLFAVLFIPVYANMDQLYPWTELGHHEEGAEHGEAAHGAEADHGAAAGGEHSGGEHGDVNPAIGDFDPAKHYAPVNENAVHHAHETMLSKKVPYLNKGFFSIRMVIYFAAWLIIGFLLWKYSTTQDEDGDPQWTVKMQRMAPLGIILMGFSTTFAAFDWVMSLEPSWFSTIYGVNFFAQCIVSMFATTILLGLGLRASGQLGKVVNIEHFHDLGKLQFGFLIFWAYVNFSQFMLIWYASVPEEVTYYHQRWVGGWKSVSLALIFGHFIIPFFIILSRNAKRALWPLGLGAAIILCFHVVMVYWLVMPYQTPGVLAPNFVDVSCLVGIAGLYFSLVFYRMTKNPLIPVNDPRLSRSVHFVNA